MDRLIGDLLETMEMGGWLEGSVVIVAADHGQVLGEHGMLGHGFKVWEEALRIPIIIRDPSVAGRLRIETRVSLLDLFPTILEYASVPLPDDIPGRSLTHLIQGGKEEPRLFLAETRTGDPSKQAVAAMKGRYKVVVSDKGVLTFDLQSDPSESCPLPVDSSDTFMKLAEIASRVHAEGRGEESDSQDLDPETLEHLKSLGYIK